MYSTHDHVHNLFLRIVIFVDCLKGQKSMNQQHEDADIGGGDANTGEEDANTGEGVAYRGGRDAYSGGGDAYSG